MFNQNELMTISDIEITEINPNYTYSKRENFHQTLDVNFKGEIIGWIDSRTLGFNKVKDYETKRFDQISNTIP